MSHSAVAEFTLPPTLISRVDVSRLGREVESVDNELEAQKVRSQAKGESEVVYQIPPISQALSDFLELNAVDITKSKQRTKLKHDLAKFKDKAPIIHMTFASQADSESLQQLVAWIRQEIHPQALIAVGLQPALVGGVYIRTPNKVFDFSLRQHLQNKRGIITNQLEELLRG